MDGYRVDVAPIADVLAASVEVSGTLALERFDVGDETFVLREPATFHLVLTNTGTCVVAEGRVVAPVTATCARCLCEFPSDIEAEVEGFYVRPGATEGVPEEQEVEFITGEGEVDVLPALMEALVLEAPFAPLHDEECAGICAECGADLNEGPCGCGGAAAAGHPFEALKSLLDDAGRTNGSL